MRRCIRVSHGEHDYEVDVVYDTEGDLSEPGLSQDFWRVDEIRPCPATEDEYDAISDEALERVDEIDDERI